ncbi:MAG: hypothetical protein U0531_05270 [Dehalococcoidia bacterium]
MAPPGRPLLLLPPRRRGSAAPAPATTPATARADQDTEAPAPRFRRLTLGRLLGWPLLAAYFLFMTLVFIDKARKNFEPPDLSRLLTLGYFALFLLTLPLWRALVSHWRARDGVRYVVLGLLSAYAVEALFMISAPISPALRVTAATPPLTALRNLALDWLFVTPIYLAVYTLFWLGLRRYRYRFWEVFFLTALVWFPLEAGRAVFPGILLGVYFFMVYHCRDMPAYLLLQDRLASTQRSDSPRRYVYMAGLAALTLIIGLVRPQ